MVTVDEIAASVDADMLTPVVRAVLGDDAQIAGWTSERMRVVTGLPDHRGLFRFAGTAQASGRSRPWSAVLKVVQRHPAWSDDPRAARYWRREEHAFTSNLLDEVNGLTPVRCYKVSDVATGTLAFWLEDLVDEYEDGWPIERYGLAARHLGQMGGAYLTGRQLPEPEWLLRRATGSGEGGGWATATAAMLDDEKTWQHPDVRRAYPKPIVERLRAQWANRRAFQAAITPLPATLCHNDSHDENLFSRRREDGSQETVAIDWELVGLGPVSSDITFLVIATLRRLAVDMDIADALEETVLEGYVAGLRDAGWSGDENQVRLGYTAGVALRLGLVPQTVDLILNERRREEAQRSWNVPIEDLIERWAQVAYFVLDRADRAREMLRET